MLELTRDTVILLKRKPTQIEFAVSEIFHDRSHCVNPETWLLHPNPIVILPAKVWTGTKIKGVLPTPPLESGKGGFGRGMANSWDNFLTKMKVIFFCAAKKKLTHWGRLLERVDWNPWAAQKIFGSFCQDKLSQVFCGLSVANTGKNSFVQNRAHDNVRQQRRWERSSLPSILISRESHPWTVFASQKKI